MGIGNWFHGLSSLFFPNTCLQCAHPIDRAQDLLCISCERGLPLTDSWQMSENDLTDRLAGRLPVTFAAAAYIFREGTVCQQLIHSLKYHNRPDVGRLLGARFGEVLTQAPALSDLTGIVPVPVHNRRLQERGYNQAEAIATGLAAPLSLPVFPHALKRRSFKGSQTTRSKLERLENVRHSFTVGKGNFAGQHLLLVDDVMTTGATLDFCGNILLSAHPGLRLSIVTLALAEY